MVVLRSLLFGGYLEFTSRSACNLRKMAAESGSPLKVRIIVLFDPSDYFQRSEGQLNVKAVKYKRSGVRNARLMEFFFTLEMSFAFDTIDDTSYEFVFVPILYRRLSLKGRDC